MRRFWGLLFVLQVASCLRRWRLSARFFGCLALHGCSPSTALLLGIFDTGLRGRNVYWEHEDAHEEMDSGCLAVLLLYRARNNHTTIM